MPITAGQRKVLVKPSSCLIARRVKLLDTGMWFFFVLTQLICILYITNADARVNILIFKHNIMQSAGNVGYLLLTIGECYSAPETPLSAEEEVEFGQLILRKIIKNDMTLVATSNNAVQ